MTSGQMVDQWSNGLPVVKPRQAPTKPGRFTARHKGLAGLMAAASAECAVEWMGAEDPLFMLYTSGGPAAGRVLTDLTDF